MSASGVGAIGVCPECGRDTWRYEGLTWTCKQGHHHPFHEMDLGGEIKKTYSPIGGGNGSTLSIDDGGKPLAVRGPLTSEQLRAEPVTVGGLVRVDEPVVVDGPLTDEQLRAAPLLVRQVTLPPRIWHYAAEHTEQETDVVVKDAPGVGLSLYVTDIYVACHGPVVVSLEEARREDQQVMKALKFRYVAKDRQGGEIQRALVTPTKLAENSSLTLTTSAKETIELFVNGYAERDT